MVARDLSSRQLTAGCSLVGIETDSRVCPPAAVGDVDEVERSHGRERGDASTVGISDIVCHSWTAVSWRPDVRRMKRWSRTTDSNRAGRDRC